ncbi:MAG: hypothetical protein ABIO72_05720 [Patescibacteria group bacterium]
MTPPGKIIAFEKDAHPLLGLYRPLYRDGDTVYRTLDQLHDKDWFMAELAAGRIAIFDEPITPSARPIVLCFPDSYLTVVPFLEIHSVRKQPAIATCIDLSRCHETLWRIIHNLGPDSLAHYKEVFAMMVAARALTGSDADVAKLITTIYRLTLKHSQKQLHDTWTLARLFGHRFGKSLPTEPPLITA